MGFKKYIKLEKGKVTLPLEYQVTVLQFCIESGSTFTCYLMLDVFLLGLNGTSRGATFSYHILIGTLII